MWCYWFIEWINLFVPEFICSFRICRSKHEFIFPYASSTACLWICVCTLIYVFLGELKCVYQFLLEFNTLIYQRLHESVLTSCVYLNLSVPMWVYLLLYVSFYPVLNYSKCLSESRWLQWVQLSVFEFICLYMSLSVCIWYLQCVFLSGRRCRSAAGFFCSSAEKVSTELLQL